MGRSPCCEKVRMKKGRWTAEEDDKLIKYIKANGEGSWASVPKNAGLMRCGKSCRLRWINYLRAGLKRGNISAEEEEIIFNLHARFGNRWSLIASHLPGRTDNEIKNYWNTHLSRKIHSFGRPSSDALPLAILDAVKAGIPKRRGGQTSIWATKKTKYSNQLTQKRQALNKIKLDQLKQNIAVDELPVSSPQTLALEDHERVHPVSSCRFEGRREVTFGSGNSSVEETRPENSTLRRSGLEKDTTAGWGPWGGIMGCCNGVTGNELLEPNGALTFNGTKVNNEEMESTTTASGDWYSCSSITSCLDDEKMDWDWDLFVRGNELWDEKEGLSFLGYGTKTV